MGPFKTDAPVQAVVIQKVELLADTSPTLPAAPSPAPGAGEPPPAAPATAPPAAPADPAAGATPKPQ
jgi:hypothetical protein